MCSIFLKGDYEGTYLAFKGILSSKRFDRGVEKGCIIGNKWVNMLINSTAQKQLGKDIQKYNSF